ncbi:MAG: hypothetical protein KDC33_01010 [Thermoleophilia bacterium]|nr:hypothetical protein [Thermoleophilia bacterium]
MGESDPPTIWVRLVADERFRAAFIEDPLRALAAAGPVTVSPEQVRQLDDLDIEERRAFVVDLVRDAYYKGGQARFGLWDEGTDDDR